MTFFISYHQAMYRAVLTLLIGLMVSLGGSANALTFKSDGSVVQKSGKVEVESYANRFREEMSKPTKQWAKSTGSPNQVRGYFGDDALLPGSPLLRIQGINKGEEYLDAVYRLNGLKGKKALFRYIIANASPAFLEDIGLTESDAQTYLDTALAEILDDETVENVELANSLKNVQAVSLGVDSEMEEALTDQISEAIDKQMEEMVSDAVEEAVEEAVEDALDNWIEELIDYYNINPEAILEIGEDYIIVDCSLTQC